MISLIRRSFRKQEKIINFVKKLFFNLFENNLKIRKNEPRLNAKLMKKAECIWNTWAFLKKFHFDLLYRILFCVAVLRRYINGPKENRTPDPFHAMEMLYQLSYGPISENQMSENQKSEFKKFNRLIITHHRSIFSKALLHF